MTFDVTRNSVDTIIVRLAKSGKSVVRVNGEQADELIRSLMQTRGGEWADMLNQWNNNHEDRND